LTLRDLRYALRSLAKSPGFFLVATACLGLALALNTTTVAILDAMLHPSLPVRDDAQLFYINMWGRQAANDATPWERYQTLRAAKFYDEIALITWAPGTTVRAGDEVNERVVSRVSGNFYLLLGVKPELGRLPGPGTPEDVAVVSHDFWERALGGRSLDGLRIWIDEQEFRVLGVLPSAMTFPPMEVSILLPRATEQTGVGLRFIMPVVRVRKGLTRQVLATELAVLARRLSPAYAFVPHPIAAHPLELRQIHFAMAGAAFLVLLIACANLASLMLVRGAARRGEIALRLALGAGRQAVVRQLIAEAAVIAAVGMAAGLLLTLWAIPILGSQMPPSVATLGIVRPHASWRVFAFGALAAIGTIALFGVWPALRASDVDLSEPLKDSAAITGRTRWRYHPLVVVEVALSLVLLMGVVLLTRAANRLTEATLGFDRQGLLRARVWLGAGVRPDSAQVLSRNLLARVAALPEVRSVAAVGEAGTRSVKSEFFDGVNGVLASTKVFPVGVSFLRTLGIPVLRGRDFGAGDEEAGAVIVDDVVASALWPDGRAVGRLVRIDPDRAWVRVVGVARRALAGGPGSGPDPAPRGAVYQAWRPRQIPAYGWQLAIRASGLDGAAAMALRRGIVDALGSRMLFVEPWLMHFDDELRARFFLMDVFAAFSTFALLLAAVGLYGVVSYAVSRRMREYAVRIALGAARGDMMKLVARDAGAMTLAGIGLGAFVAMGCSSLLEGWLYNVYHTDALSLVMAEAVLLIAAVAATAHPAIRAMRADPIEILRAI
jgi:predicted permease